MTPTWRELEAAGRHQPCRGTAGTGPSLSLREPCWLQGHLPGSPGGSGHSLGLRSGAALQERESRARRGSLSCWRPPHPEHECGCQAQEKDGGPQPSSSSGFIWNISLCPDLGPSGTRPLLTAWRKSRAGPKGGAAWERTGRGNGIFPFKWLPGATEKTDSSQRCIEEKDRNQQVGARAELSGNWGKKVFQRG